MASTELILLRNRVATLEGEVAQIKEDYTSLLHSLKEEAQPPPEDTPDPPAEKPASQRRLKKKASKKASKET